MNTTFARRIVAVALLLVMVVSLTACESTDTPASSSKSASQTQASKAGSVDSQAADDVSQEEPAESGASAANTSPTAPASTGNKPVSSTPAPSQAAPSVTVVSAATTPASSLAPIISQPTTSLSPTITALTPIQTSAYYGRGKLSGNEQKAYDAIASGIKEAKAEISLSSYSLTQSAVAKILEYVRADYPQYFWLGNDYNMAALSGGKITKLLPTYTFSGSALTEAKNKFDAAVNNLLKTVSGSWSDYDRELVIHDWLCQNVTYDGSSANAHNAYGALVERKAVCEGYARAFQYLLYQSGVPSLIVMGTSKGENHAWLMVKIGGSYYHVDVTWDDQKTTTYHAYFNLSDAVIKEDHTVGSENYALPTASSMDANYFRKSGLVLKAPFDVNTVAGALRGGNGNARFYIDGSTADFSGWVAANHNSIASAMGIAGGYTYQLGSLGHEISLTFNH